MCVFFLANCSKENYENHRRRKIFQREGEPSTDHHSENLSLMTDRLAEEGNLEKRCGSRDSKCERIKPRTSFIDSYGESESHKRYLPLYVVRS